MTIKHKVVQDFQFISSDKKIFILKSGTILEEYKYKVKNETINIDRDIIDKNPEFFLVIDWKNELTSYIKAQKLPQPAQISKKIIPFIEDMILSSIQQPSVNTIDNSKELDRKEKILIDKEEEIDIRLKRVEKREESYKEDIKALDKNEDSLRELSKSLMEKQLDIEDKLQNINERERNLDRSILESASEIDTKYKDLQNKIDKDLKALSEGERNLEIKHKELKIKEQRLSQIEAQLLDKSRNIDIRYDEIKNMEENVNRINEEIKIWEGQHWKMRRPPPSAIID